MPTTKMLYLIGHIVFWGGIVPINSLVNSFDILNGIHCINLLTIMNIGLECMPLYRYGHGMWNEFIPLHIWLNDWKQIHIRMYMLSLPILKGRFDGISLIGKVNGNEWNMKKSTIGIIWLWHW